MSQHKISKNEHVFQGTNDYLFSCIQVQLNIFQSPTVHEVIYVDHYFMEELITIDAWNYESHTIHEDMKFHPISIKMKSSVQH